jgi:hypothetical protein
MWFQGQKIGHFTLFCELWSVRQSGSRAFAAETVWLIRPLRGNAASLRGVTRGSEMIRSHVEGCEGMGSIRYRSTIPWLPPRSHCYIGELGRKAVFIIVRDRMTSYKTT